MHRIAHRLVLVIDAAESKLASMFGRGAQAQGEDVRASGRLEAPAPRIPLQPPGPLLTLDPVLGTIVADGEGVPASPGAGVGATTAGSWVPVPGTLARIGETGRAGARRAFDAVDRLLERTGLTRAQFVVLTFVGPFVVAFLIDAVASMR